MTTPTPADYKAYFTREFDYGVGKNAVTDADIQRALNEASLDFNPGLWVNAAEQKIAYLYLTAFLLVSNIQAAGGLSPSGGKKGIRNRGDGVVSSKGVGSVSLSYSIPQSISENPVFRPYLKNEFGERYLEFISKRICGNVGVVSGYPRYLSGE